MSMGILALIVAFITMLVNVAGIKPSNFFDEHTLKHTKNLIEKSQLFGLYQYLVGGFLDKVDRLYGPSWSFRSFSISYLLALIYPFLFFVWAYSFADGTSIFAGIEIFPPNFAYRHLVLPLFVVYLMITMLLMINSAKIDRLGVILFSHWLVPFMASFAYRLALACVAGGVIWFVTQNLMSTVVVIVAVAVARTRAVVVIFAPVFVGAGAVGVSVGVAVAVAVAAGIAVAGGVSVALASSAFTSGDYTTSLTFAVFLILLPLLNALFDWVSWGCSRYFLLNASEGDKQTFRHVGEDGWQNKISDLRAGLVRLGKISVDVVADGVLAVVFMIFLCLSLPVVIEWINSFYLSRDTEALIDWRAMALVARDDPWGKGFMVTMMVFTTLIPTIIHIALGLLAVIIRFPFGRIILHLLNRYEKSKSNLYFLGIIVFFLAYACFMYWLISSLYTGVVHLFNADVSTFLYNVAMTLYGP